MQSARCSFSDNGHRLQNSALPLDKIYFWLFPGDNFYCAYLLDFCDALQSMMFAPRSLRRLLSFFDCLENQKTNRLRSDCFQNYLCVSLSGLELRRLRDRIYCISYPLRHSGKSSRGLARCQLALGCRNNSVHLISVCVTRDPPLEVMVILVDSELSFFFSVSLHLKQRLSCNISQV